MHLAKIACAYKCVDQGVLQTWVTIKFDFKTCQVHFVILQWLHIVHPLAKQIAT